MLTPDQQDKNLGTLKFGKPHNFTYTLTNLGGNTANIVKLSMGCSSCTTAGINTNKVEPGQTATVSATFTPGSTGLNAKNISVAYNINGVPLNLVLKFKANVIA